LGDEIMVDETDMACDIEMHTEF